MLPHDHRLRRLQSAISEDRRGKRPLTHRHGLFAVWHRLPHNLPASSFPPFMVELFAASGFAEGPRLWSRVGPACRQVGSSPRRPRLNEPAGLSPELPLSGCGPDPLEGIFTPLDESGLTQSEVGPCRPSSPFTSGRFAHRIEHRDYSVGRLLWPTTPAVVSRKQDYADERPSNWASASRRTQLYAVGIDADGKSAEERRW